MARELQTQARVNGRREIGIRHVRGWATSDSLKRKWAVESSKQLHHWSLCSPGATVTHQIVSGSKKEKRKVEMWVESQFSVSFTSSLQYALSYHSITPLLSFSYSSPVLHRRSLSASLSITPLLSYLVADGAVQSCTCSVTRKEGWQVTWPHWDLLPSLGCKWMSVGKDRTGIGV